MWWCFVCWTKAWWLVEWREDGERGGKYLLEVDNGSEYVYGREKRNDMDVENGETEVC